jgi:hypothetical protein
LGASAGSKRWKSDDGTVEIVSTELLFCDAVDLAADMGIPLGGPGAMVWQGRAALGEAISMFAREVVGGRLVGYLVRVLANTTMIARGDGAGSFAMTGRDALDKAFTGRQRYIFPAVKLALEVTYRGFLDGFALIGLDPPTMPEMTLPSEDSSPSTSATG